jgi:hypothetical protein
MILCEIEKLDEHNDWEYIPIYKGVGSYIRWGRGTPSYSIEMERDHFGLYPLEPVEDREGDPCAIVSIELLNPVTKFGFWESRSRLHIFGWAKEINASKEVEVEDGFGKYVPDRLTNFEAGLIRITVFMNLTNEQIRRHLEY